MNEVSIQVSYIFGTNKIINTEKGRLDPRVRRREARLKALPETREVELTHGN